jgi:protein-disulfide isomerase
MNEQWKSAALAGLVSAVLALAVVFGAGALKILPGTSDARIREYLIAHPDMVFTMIQKVQANQADEENRRRQAAIDKIGLKRFFDPAVAYVTGPAKAKNTFVEFFDYNCGHCRNNVALVKKLYETRKKEVRFAFIELPIFGEDSKAVARAAIASRRQDDRYLTLHFALMSEKELINNDLLYADAVKSGLDINKLTADLQDPNINTTIADARKLAEQALASGTPFFIVNGKPHDGEITEAELKKLLK